MTEPNAPVKSTHTPGPWADEHDPLGYSGERRVWSSNGRNIALIRPVGDPEETLANAHLIAAAPDLLEALDAIIGVQELSHNAAGFTMVYCSRSNFARARAAIAKARGEAQP